MRRDDRVTVAICMAVFTIMMIIGFMPNSLVTETPQYSATKSTVKTMSPEEVKKYYGQQETPKPSTAPSPAVNHVVVETSEDDVERAIEYLSKAMKYLRYAENEIDDPDTAYGFIRDAEDYVSMAMSALGY